MHLITSLGVNTYQVTQYHFDGQLHQSCFAPAALGKIKNLAGGKATILVTEDAYQKNYKSIAQELTDIGIQPKAVIIPTGSDEESILEIVRLITMEVDSGEEVYLDVTFSFRHLPFIYLAALIYLSGLKDVKVQGIFYGAYELGKEGPTQLIDITSLFRLIEWYHGVTTARQDGDFRAIARLLRSDVSKQFQLGEGDKNWSNVSNLVTELAFALDSVLPLEIGLKASLTSAKASELAENANQTLAAKLVMDALKQIMEHWRLEIGINAIKSDITLNNLELKRQLDLAQWYAESNNLQAALLVLREWIISRLQHASGVHNNWLGREKRLEHEKTLNVLSERVRAELGTPIEKELAKTWNSISLQRNRFAHAGMDAEEVKVSKDAVKNAIDSCKKLLDLNIPPKMPDLPGKKVLVTPLGLSKGVLYSGILLEKPDQLLIITSEQGQCTIQEILTQAEAQNLPYETIILQDPHQGFLEINSQLSISPLSAILDYLACACSVTINITGGTTAMQYATEQIASVLNRLGIASKKIALVDRRPYEEQKANPYVCGEKVDL